MVLAIELKKKTVLIKNYEEGGLKMLDLYNYNLTMKFKWLKNLVSEGNKDCYEFTNNIFDINKLFNSGINPFPNKPWFLRVCSIILLKTLWEKEKLLVTSNFSFSHSVFNPFQ